MGNGRLGGKMGLSRARTKQKVTWRLPQARSRGGRVAGEGAMWGLPTSL